MSVFLTGYWSFVVTTVAQEGEERRRETPKVVGIRFFQAPCCVAQLGRVHCACNTLDGLLDIPHGVSS